MKNISPLLVNFDWLMEIDLWKTQRTHFEFDLACLHDITKLKFIDAIVREFDLSILGGSSIT